MVIAVDFDGTLCVDKFPEIGEETEVLQHVRVLKNLGCKLILYTCRRDANLDNAVLWCKNRGLTFDAINENLKENIEEYGGDTRKVWANVYLEDKAMVSSENIVLDMVNYLKKLEKNILLGGIK